MAEPLECGGWTLLSRLCPSAAPHLKTWIGLVESLKSGVQPPHSKGPSNPGSFIAFNCPYLRCPHFLLETVQMSVPNCRAPLPLPRKRDGVAAHPAGASVHPGVSARPAGASVHPGVSARPGASARPADAA